MKRAPLDTGVVAGRAGPFWRSIDVVEQTGSTNADLLTRANAGDDIDGAVLVAEYQSAGRGRHGRHWSAPARSQLSFSVGLSLADVTPDAWGWLPLAAGVAVVDAVAEAAGVSSGLKWPNDVLAGSVDAPRKLAGILAEVAAPAPAVVVGVGLNVTMTAEEAPDPRATSLHLLGAAQTDRNVLLAAVLRRLADRIGRWRDADGADAELIADYRSRSHTLGSRVRATMPGDQHVEGVARGIDDLGRLQIDTDVGLVTVSAGDIAHLRPVPP
ncbi:biotin--[acetyl-CoA-carboxylase] ligase [Mycobacterium sp. CPCC 205372]|uniref:biotin--[biotin carboxyl-carrier protein] ligase n=1 Tax=Mycobacterium hippophais TaxID=3016340 RepID=A0ABT4PRV4_9MYCO|nr:biotin--[acetyl-CoA-carboxylase] ligase [Mycobacterium hippophais]MCZ8379292.1 biotin--[acetyl-CoA-carboxylase] ligase [Mycobacterium hippophais]